MTNKLILLAAVAVTVLSAGCKKLPNDAGKKGDIIESGTVVQGGMSSTWKNRSMKYTVWVPAGYDDKKTYPFLYLLHGYGDDNNSWISKGGADRIANKYLADGGVPMVIVMPDGLTDFYVGAFEKYMLEELMPRLGSTYHCNGKRALAGLSMGGFGTLYYGLKYPDMFLYGYAMSPATDVSSFRELIIAQSDRSVFPYFTLESGTNDYTVSIESVRSCDEMLSGYELPHRFIERPGGHDWNFWPVCLEKALVEIGKVFK